MKEIRWDAAKDERLKTERGVSFEQVEAHIRAGQVLAVLENPSKNYVHQRMFIVEIEGYVYYVPFVESDEALFLKTIIPSRKLTRQYGQKQDDNHAEH